MAEDAGPTQSNCPPLSLADRLKIYAAKWLTGGNQGGGNQGGTTSEDDTQDTTGLGIDVPVESSDYFRWRAYSSDTNVQVTFYGRIRQKSGTIIPFSHTIDAPSGGAIQTKTVATGAGILIGAAASVPVDSFSSGSVSAVGEIGRLAGGNFVPHHLLFSGQLDDLTPLSSQVSQPTTATNRAVMKALNDTTTRAIPVTITVTPTSGYRMRFTRVQAAYTMSAVAGTRVPIIYFRQGGNSFMTLVTNLSRTAGQVGAIEGSIGSGSGVASNVGYGSLPQDLYFYDAVDVTIDADNRQAGDSITTSFIRWEET